MGFWKNTLMIVGALMILSSGKFTMELIGIVMFVWACNIPTKNYGLEKVNKKW